MQMLALVPDNATVRGAGITVGYADYDAALANREGAAQPESHAQFMAMLDARDDAARLALMSIPGSGPPNFRDYFQQLGEMPELVGFDFFDIEQGLFFGAPPSIGIVLSGDFDADAIGTAYSTRGYTESDVDGMTLWCPADGCDTGLQQNLRGHNPGNPFGGHLGRSEPLLIAPDYVVDSADIATIEASAAALTDERPSLADDESYRAAVEAITSEGVLIQAQFIEAALLRPFDVASMIQPFGDDSGILTNEDALTEFLDELRGYGELPPYLLATIADVIIDDQQVAVIALVYNDATSAETAGATLVQRFFNLSSLRYDRPYIELVAGREATIDAPRVFTSESTGKSVALFRIIGALPSSTPDEDGMIVQGSMLYQLLATMLYSRDLYWLATDIPQFE
ncbi:MAG: hypothetical protein H7175_05075 [Burkholderiales bacterium]|nr:hypothetical protein [Anaerolineae bacterium]